MYEKNVIIKIIKDGINVRNDFHTKVNITSLGSQDAPNEFI